MLAIISPSLSLNTALKISLSPYKSGLSASSVTKFDNFFVASAIEFIASAVDTEVSCYISLTVEDNDNAPTDS